MNEMRIEPASDAALPACLALLPPVNHPEVVVFAARDPDGTLAGAGGILWQSWGEPPGFPVWIQVLPDRRRRGVGRALARALVNRARGEAQQLWAARPLEEAAPSAVFARACGFEPAGRQLIYDADGATFLAHVAAIVERLRARGRIPAGVEMVDLAPELVGPVAELVHRELNSAPAGLAAMLAQALEQDPATAPVDRLRSKVLLVDGRVGGALLSRRRSDGRDTRIVCNVVAPEWRRGWANVMLLESTTRAGVETGGVRFGFDCADTMRDTIGLAERGGADLIGTEVTFRYAVTSA